MKLEDVKIGMKVIMKQNYDFSVRKNEIGTVIDFIDSSITPVAIQFDNFNENRHVCGFAKRVCKDGYGYYVPANIIEPYIEKKRKSKTDKQNLELIFNGTMTIALLKGESRIYSKGVAKLHHADTYNQLEGIRVAVGRALGLEVDFPKEKTLNDFTNEELLKELEKRMLKNTKVKKVKYLTYDEIIRLPNRTVIKIKEQYETDDKVACVNQDNKTIDTYTGIRYLLSDVKMALDLGVVEIYVDK